MSEAPSDPLDCVNIQESALVSQIFQTQETPIPANPQTLIPDEGNEDEDEESEVFENPQENFVLSPRMPQSLTGSRNSSSRRGRKRKGQFNLRKQQLLDKKFQTLMLNLNPIPFRPPGFSDLPKHEPLLRNLGLWDFVTTSFDANLRKDLIAQLVASYDSRACFINNKRYGVSRADLARAFKIPLMKDRKNVAGVGQVDLHSEPHDGDSVTFLSEFVSSYMLLHEDMWLMPEEVMNWIKVVKEGHPEKVDWAGMLWFMVEKELSQGENLRDCYYASHLQHLMKEQKVFLREEADGGRQTELIELGNEGDEEEEEEENTNVEVPNDVQEEDANIEVHNKVEDVNHEAYEKLDDAIAVPVEEMKIGDAIVVQGEEMKIGDVTVVQDEEMKLGDATVVQGEEMKLGDATVVQGDEMKLGDATVVQGDEMKLGDATVVQGEEMKLGDATVVQGDEMKLGDATIFQGEEMKLGDALVSHGEEMEIGDVLVFQGEMKNDEIEGPSVKLTLGQDREKEEGGREVDLMDFENHEESDGDGTNEEAQWLMNGKNDLGEHFLQHCSSVNGRGLVDPEDSKLDEDNEEFEDEEDEEMGDKFQDFPNDVLEGDAFTGNYLQSMEGNQISFGSHSHTHMQQMESGPSFLNESGKRVMEHENGIFNHSLADNNNNNNKRLRINGPSEPKPVDFETCMENAQQMMDRARMFYSEKEQALQQAGMNEQLLLEEVQKRDEMISLLHKTRHEENQKHENEKYRYERELLLMGNLVKGYRKAMRDTQKEFDDYRQRAQLPEEPAYKHVGAGLMLSTGEIERMRKKEEEEFRVYCLIMAQRMEEAENCFAGKMDACLHKINMFNERLTGLEAGAKELTELFAKREVLQTEEEVANVVEPAVNEESMPDVVEPAVNEESMPDVVETAAKEPIVAQLPAHEEKEPDVAQFPADIEKEPDVADLPADIEKEPDVDLPADIEKEPDVAEVPAAEAKVVDVAADNVKEAEVPTDEANKADVGADQAKEAEVPADEAKETDVAEVPAEEKDPELEGAPANE